MTKKILLLGHYKIFNFFQTIFISEQYDERNRNKECCPPCSLMWFSVGIPNKVENIGNNGTAQFFFKSETIVQKTIFANRQYIFLFHQLFLKQALSNRSEYSGRRLIGSLWDLDKLIPLTD
jgi:hypothetical protein